MEVQDKENKSGAQNRGLKPMKEAVKDEGENGKKKEENKTDPTLVFKLKKQI